MKNKYHDSIYNESEKAKAQSVMILWGEFAKNNKSISLFILCGCVKNSHNGLHLRQFFLLALFLIFLFFNYVSVCEATSDIQLSIRGFINKFCAI